MIRQHLIWIFLFSGLFINAQSKITLEGTYQGENLYVQNPHAADGNSFCVSKVLVNGKEIFCKTDASAFEIRLDSSDFKLDDKVIVEIFHKEGCLPKVLNPAHGGNPRIRYDILKTEIQQDSLLYWKAIERGGKWNYIIEQFRWNKWVKIGTMDAKSGSDTTEYFFNVKKYYHSSENSFRVKITDFKGKLTTSNPVKVLKDAEEDYVTGRYLKTDTIVFKKETLVELYDRSGNILQRGVMKELPMENLKKGNYFLNYDNKTAEINRY